MVTPEKTIVWDPEAIDQLREAYKYIQKKSTRNALKVLNDIEMAVSRLLVHPELYPPTNTNLTTTELSGPLKNTATVWHIG